jgi:hypothetical protein
LRRLLWRAKPETGERAMDRHDQSDELIRSKLMMPHKFKQARTSCFFTGHVEGIDAPQRRLLGAGRPGFLDACGFGK